MQDLRLFSMPKCTFKFLIPQNYCCGTTNGKIIMLIPETVDFTFLAFQNCNLNKKNFQEAQKSKFQIILIKNKNLNIYRK